MTRQFPTRAYRSLKSATRSLLEACGPLKVAAQWSRIGSTSQLHRFGSPAPDNEDRFIPVDVALDLMSASGDPSLLYVMASALGFDLVPAATGASSAPATTRAVFAMGEAGQMVAALADCLHDGTISAAEIQDKDLIGDLRDLIAASSRLQAALEEVVSDDCESEGE